MTEGLTRKGFFTRDSLGACDQSDFYDSIRNPNAPKRPRAVELPKDSLESVQKKLEDEARQQLLLERSGMASHAFHLAALVGKVVFMCFVLPPYLVCYSFPKFIVTGLIPKVFDLLLYPICKMRDFVRKKLTAIKIRLLQLAAIFGRIKTPFMRLKTIVQSAIASIASFYRNCRELILTPQRYLNGAVRRLLGALRTKGQNLILRFKNTVNRSMKRAKHYIMSQFERLGNMLDRFFVHPIVGFFNPKITSLQLLIGRVKRETTHLLDKVQTAVVNFVKNPKRELARLGHYIGRRAMELAKKINASTVEWAKIQVRELSLTFKAVRAKIYELGASRMVLAKKELLDWVAATGLAMQRFATMIQREAARIPGFLAEAIKSPSRWVKGCLEKGGQRYRAFKESINRYLREASNTLKDHIQRITALVKKHFNKWMRWLWGHLKRLPDALRLYAQKLMTVVASGCKKAGLRIRVILAWSKVISIYGMQLVREASQEFTKTLSIWFNTR